MPLGFERVGVAIYTRTLLLKLVNLQGRLNLAYFSLCMRQDRVRNAYIEMLLDKVGRLQRLNIRIYHI